MLCLVDGSTGMVIAPPAQASLQLERCRSAYTYTCVGGCNNYTSVYISLRKRKGHMNINNYYNGPVNLMVSFVVPLHFYKNGWFFEHVLGWWGGHAARSNVEKEGRTGAYTIQKKKEGVSLFF